MNEWTERYEYNERSVGANVPLTGGVYRLIYHSGDKYYVFYVEKSENLKQRLLSHLSSSETNVCVRKRLEDYPCYFRYLKVNTQTEQDRIERQQIDEYNPSCNRY